MHNRKSLPVSNSFMGSVLVFLESLTVGPSGPNNVRLSIYSDSSKWKDYIETNILPRIEAHSIILNWSKRREWGSRMQLETKLFNQWAGPGEFVPVAILFSPIWKARTFRLCQLSENSKHGKVRVSKETEQAFLETVKRLLPPGGS